MVMAMVMVMAMMMMVVAMVMVAMGWRGWKGVGDGGCHLCSDGDGGWVLEYILKLFRSAVQSTTWKLPLT